MNTLKRNCFWVLFGFVVLVGFFFIAELVLQRQSPVIPDAEAQIAGQYSGSSSGSFVGYVGMMPQNILFSYQAFPGLQSGSGYRSQLPGDVMFGQSALYGVHPGSYMFTQNRYLAGAVFPADVMFPGDIIIESLKDGSNGKTKMRTILTCSGCSQTMSTCDWDCGPTFAFCSTNTIYTGSITGLTCPGYINSISDGSGFTLMTCSSDNILCRVGRSITTNTCDVFGCRAYDTYPSVSISSITCGGSLYGRCIGQWDGIYGWSIPYEPTSSPAF